MVDREVPVFRQDHRLDQLRGYRFQRNPCFPNLIGRVGSAFDASSQHEWRIAYRNPLEQENQRQTDHYQPDRNPDQQPVQQALLLDNRLTHHRQSYK